MDKLAAAIVYLSLGIPFIQAGQEFLRTKPLPGGAVFDGNSYKSPDAVNGLKWNRKTEYRQVFDYYKGLIEFRKAHSALRISEGAEAAAHLEFFDRLPKGVVGYRLTGDDRLEELIVFLNNNNHPVNLQAVGRYDIYVDAEHAGDTPLYSVEGSYAIAPVSAMVLGKPYELHFEI
jgi:pullulanase